MAVTINPAALTTLATLKSALSITVSTFDDLLKLSINGATGAIENYCNRVFGKATITDERHVIAGGVRVCLKRPPLVTLTTIEYEDSTSAISADNLLTESSKWGIIYVKSGLVRGGLARPGIAQDAQPGTEPPTLLATYVGGYVTPQQAEAGMAYAAQAITLPGEIEIACIRYAAQLYASLAESTSATIVSETLDNASVEYSDSSEASESGDLSASPLPAKIAALLRAHRRIQFQ